MRRVHSMFIASLVAAFSLLIVPASPVTLASSYTSAPNVAWLASSVPTGTSVDLSRIVATDSLGHKTWTTSGNCTIKGNSLVTSKKPGACRIGVRIAATPRFAAAGSSTALQVARKSELNVLAAASLAASFTELGNVYMKKFLNVTIKFNFAGSSTLATQIQQGAPVDVIAMADTTNMDKIVGSGQVSASTVKSLVSNKLAILVQRGNPSKIAALSDLTRSGLKVVLCDTAQPCGKYAATVLSNAKVTLTPASREASASGIVSRIANGEADAGIAYVTDGLISGDKVDPIVIPDSVNVVASYPIATAKTPTSRDTAAIASFVGLATGTLGDAIFSKYGFIVP